MGLVSDLSKEKGKRWALVLSAYMLAGSAFFGFAAFAQLHMRDVPIYNPSKLKAQCEQVLRMKCHVIAESK